VGAGTTKVDGTGIQLDVALLKEAGELGIDLPAALNQQLRELVRRVRRECWLEENREALADANVFLERHGLWSDGKRQF
jgi:antitoxin CcdA